MITDNKSNSYIYIHNRTVTKKLDPPKYGPMSSNCLKNKDSPE